MIAKIELLAKSFTQKDLELRYEVVISVSQTTGETVEERCKQTTEWITESLNTTRKASEDLVLYGQPSSSRPPPLAKRPALHQLASSWKTAPVNKRSAPSQPSDLRCHAKRIRNMSGCHKTPVKQKEVHNHANTIVNAMLAGARRIVMADLLSWQDVMEKVKPTRATGATGAPLTIQQLDEACDHLIITSPTTVELDRKLDNCIEDARWTMRLATLARCFVEKTRIYLHTRSKSNADSKMYRGSANDRRQFAGVANIIIALSNAMIRPFGEKAFLVCALLTACSDDTFSFTTTIWRRLTKEQIDDIARRTVEKLQERESDRDWQNIETAFQLDPARLVTTSDVPYDCARAALGMHETLWHVSKEVSLQINDCAAGYQRKGRTNPAVPIDHQNPSVACTTPAPDSCFEATDYQQPCQASTDLSVDLPSRGVSGQSRPESAKYSPRITLSTTSHGATHAHEILDRNLCRRSEQDLNDNLQQYENASQPCSDLVPRQEQITGSQHLAYNPEPHTLLVGSFLDKDPSIDFTAWIPKTCSAASNHNYHKALAQPLTIAQDLELPYNMRCDLDSSTRLQSHQRYRTEEVNVEALYTREFAPNPRSQPQLMGQLIVPDTAQSIQFAIKGDISGLNYLFSQGLASPRDVRTSRGFSLLRWTLYGGMHNYKTVQFLLSQGAFVDEESYEHVWDFAFRRKCSTIELRELRCITLNPPDTYTWKDWPEEQHLPLIHQIVLGRSGKTLVAELDENADAVRVTDAMGRTALDWATALAQLPDMKILIDRGSPLNSIDVSGRTTVLHAVDSHNDDALRMLLEAGSDPDPDVPNRSSPLNAAAFGGLTGMVELLLKFGAKVEACNPEGRTALQAVTRTQKAKCAKRCAQILLDHGADPTRISTNGSSPFAIAVEFNKYDLLMLFTKYCDTSRRFDGRQLLPTIAKFADAKTLSILASSDLLKSILFHEDSFAEDFETLSSRTDYNVVLGKAFTDLRRD